jgi:hypothetical protein
MKQELAELAVMLGRRMENVSVYTTAKTCVELSRLATRAQSIAVALCNGDITQETFEKLKERLTFKANTILQPFHLRAVIGGDPRGPVFRLHNHGGMVVRGNTMGGDEDGYAVAA